MSTKKKKRESTSTPQREEEEGGSSTKPQKEGQAAPLKRKEEEEKAASPKKEGGCVGCGWVGLRLGFGVWGACVCGEEGEGRRASKPFRPRALPFDLLCQLFE